jgi:Ca2+-binding RTX toxin-like protein
VLNISLTEGASDDYTTLIVADVETINIDVTEDTVGGSATSQTGTVGLTITQTTVAAGGSGAAQSVVITGSEDITIDTAVAAATIDASGLSARLATTPGLVMSTIATATTAMPGQTVTGSSGADTIFGSTGGDTLTGGAGNDNFTASTGADTIDGGTGTDTFTGTTALTAASIEGTGSGTSTGVVVNLGATTLTGAAVLGTTTQNLSGSLTV